MSPESPLFTRFGVLALAVGAALGIALSLTLWPGRDRAPPANQRACA
jgi:hypothetical protein